MNENDLFDVLAAPSREKLAGMLDSLKAVPQATLAYVKSHPEQVAGALVGAGALTLGQYLQNKAGKSGASPQQRMSQRLVDATEEMKEDSEADGKPLGFAADMAHAGAPAIKGVSDVLARHPVKGALMVAPAGGMLGYTLASKFLKHGSAKPCTKKTATMTKLSMADKWGRELVYDGMVKEALPSLMGVGLGKAMHGAVTGSRAMQVGGGAALGAGAGALKHMAGPKDEQGNRKGSLLGSMAGGAVLGGAGGAAIKPGATALAGMNNRVGKTLGGALTREARFTGNAVATQAARETAAVRGAKQSISKGRAVKSLPAHMRPAAPGAGAEGPTAMPLKKMPIKPAPAAAAPATPIAPAPAAPSATATPAAAPIAPKPPATPNPAAKPMFQSVQKPSMMDGIHAKAKGWGQTLAPSLFGPRV